MELGYRILVYCWFIGIDIKIIKRAIESFYLETEIKEHDSIKNTLLPLLNTGTVLNAIDDYYSDNIYATDWSRAKDFDSREWVKVFLPLLQSYLSVLTYESGYSSYNIDELWYQQYYKHQTHGWHTHSSNFTGVYYLEFNDSPSTEIVEPFNHDKLFPVKCKEGLLITFPSYAIHRAPKLYNDNRKTIISFNWNMLNPNKKVLEALKKYDNRLSKKI